MKPKPLATALVAAVTLFMLAGLDACSRKKSSAGNRRNDIQNCVASGYRGKATNMSLESQHDRNNNFYLDARYTFDSYHQKKGQPVVHLQTTVDYYEPLSAKGSEGKFVDTGQVITGEGDLESVSYVASLSAGLVHPKDYDRNDKRIFRRMRACVAKFPEHPEERAPQIAHSMPLPK